MKPKRKLKKWVTVALLLLPEVVIVGLLFFVVMNLNNLKPEIIIEVKCDHPINLLEVSYE